MEAGRIKTIQRYSAPTTYVVWSVMNLTARPSALCFKTDFGLLNKSNALDSITKIEGILKAVDTTSNTVTIATGTHSDVTPNVTSETVIRLESKMSSPQPSLI